MEYPTNLDVDGVELKNGTQTYKYRRFVRAEKMPSPSLVSTFLRRLLKRNRICLKLGFSKIHLTMDCLARRWADKNSHNEGSCYKRAVFVYRIIGALQRLKDF